MILTRARYLIWFSVVTWAFPCSSAANCTFPRCRTLATMLSKSWERSNRQTSRLWVIRKHRTMTEKTVRCMQQLSQYANTVCILFQGFCREYIQLWKLPLDRNRAEKVLGEGILAELISESYLHLVVIEAYDGQGSSHNLPVIFIIYGTDPCTVTLKIHSLTL